MKPLRSTRSLLMVLCAGLALSACDAQTAEVRDPAQLERLKAAAGAEQGVVPGYTVDVEVPPQTMRGQEALARVRVHPKAPWHMNLEYPVKLRLKAPADVELVAPLQHKADAERYDDQALEFAVLFTPQGGGSRKIEVEVDFAVCGEATCGPVTESVELAFEVGCRSEDTGLC